MTLAIAFDQLPRDEKMKLAQAAKLKARSAYKVASSPWAELSTRIQDALYLVSWHSVLGEPRYQMLIVQDGAYTPPTR